MSHPRQLFNDIKSIDQFESMNLLDLGFSEKQFQSLRYSFFQKLVQSKPEEVLTVIGDYEFSEREKQRIFQAAFYRNRSEEDLIRYRNSLAAPEDQALFDKATGSRSNSSRSSNGPQIETRDQLLSAISDRSVTNLSNLMRKWTQEQKSQLVDDYRNLTGADKDYLAALSVGSNTRVPTELRSEAIEHLLSLPEDHEHSKWRGRDNDAAVSIVSKNALTLLANDPAQATTWLAGLPESPIRSMAQKNLAVNWRHYDPEATKQWISTLPANEQTEINKFLESH